MITNKHRYKSRELWLDAFMIGCFIATIGNLVCLAFGVFN